MNDQTENLPGGYECCVWSILAVLFITTFMVGWSSDEITTLRVIAFTISLGFVAIIIILYRLEKRFREISMVEMPKEDYQD